MRCWWSLLAALVAAPVWGFAPTRSDSASATAEGLALADGTNTFIYVATDLEGHQPVRIVRQHLPAWVEHGHDANGTLPNDGLRSFEYDAENQLTTISLAGHWRSQFVHDGLGRKRIEGDYTWTGSGWQQTNETRFAYDGMLVLQERQFDPQLSTNDPQHIITYTRGLDISGGRQGAGGIGGLLARNDASGHAFYHADGAGNVTALRRVAHEDPRAARGGFECAHAVRLAFAPRQANCSDAGFHFNPNV